VERGVPAAVEAAESNTASTQDTAVTPLIGQTRSAGSGSSVDRGGGIGVGADGGHTRSIGLCILWAILTLGIYTFIWTYRTQDEIKRYSATGSEAFSGSSSTS